MKHLIDSVTYAPRNGPSWSRCTCGKTFRAPTPEALAERWVAHGGKALREWGPDKAPERTFSRGAGEATCHPTRVRYHASPLCRDCYVRRAS